MDFGAIQQMVVEALWQGLHAFFPRRGLGKYADVIATVASPGAGLLTVIQIPVATGEGLLLDGFGWRITAGAMTTSVLSLQISQQSVAGYDRMTVPISPTSIDWANLTPLDVWCPPASTVRLILLNTGAVAVTVQARLHGRICAATFGDRR